jgi:pilus assembly protein CpaB
MRLDRRFAIVLSISMAWALVVAGVFYRTASGAGARPRAEVVRPIVVASKTLPAGAMIDRDAVKFRSVPETLVPAGAFTKLDDVLDRPVINPIQAEEAVIEARVAAKGSGGGLAPMIPPGMRAVSVRVNDVAGVSGFVLPGMRVDVLFTGHPANLTDTVTRTVLQDLQVLSAGQTTQTDGKSQAIVVPVVTLLVNPVDAESLTLANGEGRIQLVLRNSNDRQVSLTAGRRLHEFFSPAPTKAPEPPRPLPPVPPPVRRRPSSAPSPTPAVVHSPPPAAEQMIMIRGTVKTVEVFPREGNSR